MNAKKQTKFRFILAAFRVYPAVKYKLYHISFFTLITTNEKCFIKGIIPIHLVRRKIFMPGPWHKYWIYWVGSIILILKLFNYGKSTLHDRSCVGYCLGHRILWICSWWYYSRASCHSHRSFPFEIYPQGSLIKNNGTTVRTAGVVRHMVMK